MHKSYTHAHTHTHTLMHVLTPPPPHTHKHSYFVSVMEGVSSLSTALARGNIIALTNIFVLRQSPHQLSLAPSSSESSAGPSLAPTEETQLLLSIQSHMEGIPRLEMRYCLLDALFGGPALEVYMYMISCMCKCMEAVSYPVIVCMSACVTDFFVCS